MKIAIVSPIEERVPPIKYGGTELVVKNLIDELVKASHDVTLFASGESLTSAKLTPISIRSLRNIPETLNDAKLRDIYKYYSIGQLIPHLQKDNFDIVHNHIGWRFLMFEKCFSSPMVTTLHGPLNLYYQQDIFTKFKDANYISISLNQRRPMEELNFISNVYNGIEMEKFSYNEKPSDYFAFLGRMSPEKGPVQAIEIAKLAGVKLIMAAKIDLVDEEFFKREVEPLIDEEQIKFIGEVDHDEKVELLKNARALIAPIQWEEPFGLYFIEAMACGTPVITMNRGSAPEIIINEGTGFICKNVNEAAEKVRQIEKIERKKCFDHVMANFSSKKMADNYLEAYKKVIQKG